MSGRLTKEENKAIIDLFKSGNSIANISTVLKRSEATISKIVNKYKNDNPEYMETKVDKKPNIRVPEHIVEDTIHKFYKSGLERSEADKLVRSTLPALTEQVTSADELYEIIIKISHISGVSINKSQSGRSGVYIMTEAASQKGDAQRQAFNGEPMKDYIFKPKG